MTKFNLSAAKRGEKIQMIVAGFREDVHFVGVTLAGVIVVERNAELCEVNERCLHMAPKEPRKMYIQLYKTSSGTIGCTWPHDTKEEAINSADGFVAVGPPVEVPILDEINLDEYKIVS